MPLSTTRRPGPEDQEIEQKRVELAALQQTRAERELDVEDLSAQIAAFREKYLRQVGAPFAELAEWRVRILELQALLDPSEEAKMKLKEARERARQSHADAHGDDAHRDDASAKQNAGEDGTETPLFTPSSALRTLYREVARRIHPDFCKSRDGLERRTRFMAEANRAYAADDAEALQRILDEYHEGADAAEQPAPESEISRIERQSVRAKAAIAAAELELRALGNTQMGRLKRDCEAAEQEGRDLLAELGRSVQEQIRQAEIKFNVLSRDVSLREKFETETGRA